MPASYLELVSKINQATKPKANSNSQRKWGKLAPVSPQFVQIFLQCKDNSSEAKKAPRAQLLQHAEGLISHLDGVLDVIMNAFAVIIVNSIKHNYAHTYTHF